MREAAQLGILQVHLSGGDKPTARRDLGRDRHGRRRERPLHQPHHRRGAVEARPAGEAEGVPASITCRSPFRMSTAGRERRPDRRLQGRASAKKKEVAGWVRELGLAAHHQRADAPAQHQGNAGVYRSSGRAWRGQARDRAYPVLRLGRCATKPRSVPPYELVLEEAAIVADAKERLRASWPSTT